MSDDSSTRDEARRPAGAPPVVVVLTASGDSASELVQGLGDGFRPEFASSTSEVVAHVRARDVDLVLASASMPGVRDGRLVEAIRAATDTGGPRLVVLTDADADADAIRAEGASGAIDVIGSARSVGELRSRVSLSARLARAEARADRLSVDLAVKSHQLEFVNRLKSDFLSTMSHELRTPLNAIIGFSEMMRDGIAGPMTTKQTEFVVHIFRAGEHLLRLINDILDLSKIDEGRLALELAPIDVLALVMESVDLVSPQAEKRRVAIEAKPSVDALRIECDSRRVRQMVVHLLANAIRAAPEGGTVTVGVDVVDRHRASTALPGFSLGVRSPLPESEFEAFVELHVSDDGDGIKQAKLASLFAPPSIKDTRFAKTAEGAGLGLAIVHGLAALHRGAIAVTTEAAVGTWATIWLPLRVDAFARGARR